MFVTRYEMACLESTRLFNYVVCISHSLCFFYKASQLCLLYIIFSVIANGYIYMQVIGMYCRLLNAQQGPSRVNHYFDPSFAVITNITLTTIYVQLGFLDVLICFMKLCYRLLLIRSLDKQKCHAPIPGPTRLANPNQFRGAKPYTGTSYFFFFRAELISVVYK